MIDDIKEDYLCYVLYKNLEPKVTSLYRIDKYELDGDNDIYILEVKGLLVSRLDKISKITGRKNDILDELNNILKHIISPEDVHNKY
jgi:hypothetical protein